MKIKPVNFKKVSKTVKTASQKARNYKGDRAKVKASHLKAKIKKQEQLNRSKMKYQNDKAKMKYGKAKNKADIKELKNKGKIDLIKAKTPKTSLGIAGVIAATAMDAEAKETERNKEQMDALSKMVENHDGDENNSDDPKSEIVSGGH